MISQVLHDPAAHRNAPNRTALLDTTRDVDLVAKYVSVWIRSEVAHVYADAQLEGVCFI